jgi:hypothetical protein
MAQALPMTPPAPLEIDPVDWEAPLFPSVPWSEEIEVEFLAEHGYALQPRVDALFEGDAAQARRVRRDFWATVSRLYAANFAGQAAQVCEALGVELSGHFLAEETILQHMVLHGDLLRALRHLHRPGVDLLTCNLDLFPNQIITHKTAQSAAFLSGRRRVMSETSDYFERYLGDCQGAPVGDILCAVALQYLLGVRDFCVYFEWRAMLPGEFGQVCEFLGRLLEIGGEAAYAPEVGVYFPIEYVWEHYTPVCPVDSGLASAPIFGTQVDLQSEPLAAISQVTTETCRRLFYDNVQYVLCERQDLGRLAARGIATILYYGPGDPDKGLLELCREAGLRCVPVREYEGKQECGAVLAVNGSVVYGTYEHFIFAVNYGATTADLTLARPLAAVFPYASTQRQAAAERVTIPPHQCVFLLHEMSAR